MMKKFAVGLLSAAIIAGSSVGGYAQALTPAQNAALAACSAAALAADGGAACAIALAALPPGAFAVIAAQLRAGAGNQISLLNGAIASSNVSTAAVGGPATTPGFVAPAGSLGGGGGPSAAVNRPS